MTESYKRLYKKLRDTEFGCVPPGFHDTTEVYELVEDQYSELCDDTVLCRDVCGTDNDQPEWMHRIRTVQQDLKRYPTSRVQNLSKGWYYGPTDIDVTQVPQETTEFALGNYYNRWELHDEFGGQRYNGISTPSDRPIAFLFTGPSGGDYGYEDEFLNDDTFLYTGEGTEGDMNIKGGNKSIRDHQQEDEELHLFEDTEYPWIVTYTGQFEYVSHRWDTLLDREGERRKAIRFRLQPIGGTEVDIEGGSPSSLSDTELFKKAKESSPTRSEASNSTGSSGSSGASSGRSYPRSEIVKQFALREADGICQGCEKEAPFLDGDGEPFLEVHHLHRRSDGGADDPENVIALCPNCHRRVHHGKAGSEFNQDLIEKAERRNQQYSN